MIKILTKYLENVTRERYSTQTQGGITTKTTYQESIAKILRVPRSESHRGVHQIVGGVGRSQKSRQTVQPLLRAKDQSAGARNDDIRRRSRRRPVPSRRSYFGGPLEGVTFSTSFQCKLKSSLEPRPARRTSSSRRTTEVAAL
jgi:hypothetical protein